ncbi:hypothetical protein HK405_002797, partial [Cladochytrium tenue]
MALQKRYKETRFILKSVGGADGASKHLLDRPSTSIGRSEECPIRVRHPSVSGIHCTIDIVTSGPDGGGAKTATITDHSFNGTFLNERRLVKGVAVQLKEDDSI